MTAKVLNPGLSTTVQDLGRPGYFHLGIPVGGAMDNLALRAANLLVGNEESAAGLEAVFIGPELEFSADALIAVTGRIEARICPVGWQNSIAPCRVCDSRSLSPPSCPSGNTCSSMRPLDSLPIASAASLSRICSGKLCGAVWPNFQEYSAALA